MSNYGTVSCALFDFEIKNNDTRNGKLSHNELERSTIFNGDSSTINMVIFNSYVKLPEGNSSKCF